MKWIAAGDPPRDPGSDPSRAGLVRSCLVTGRNRYGLLEGEQVANLPVIVDQVRIDARGAQA